jgi:hypothetical protein
MIQFEGYDANSPTLRATHAVGTCQGPEWDNVTAWVDAAVPIHSGDLVRLHLLCADGSHIAVVKRLEVDRAGHWYGLTVDMAMPLILFQVIAVEKVVGRSPPETSSRPVFDHVASAADLALCNRFSASACAEWQREGFVRGPEWPGFDAVLAKGYPPEVRE